MNKKSDIDKLKKLEELLLNSDLNCNKSKNIILNRLLFKIETGTIKSNDIEKDDKYMSKKISKQSKIIATTLATLILGVSAAYASGTLSSIIEHFQIGNTEIIQYAATDPAVSEESNVEELPLDFMEQGYKGKLFDKNGKEALYGSLQEYYTADGILITGMGVKDLPNGEHEFMVLTAENDPSYEKPLTLEEVKNIADKKINFPSYLPDGYNFKEGYTSFKGAGTNVNYSNKSGDSITILAATTKEAACGVASTDTVTETTIDGKKVMISTNCAFWESNNTSYQFYWNFTNENSMDMTEVSKIIESIK